MCVSSGSHSMEWRIVDVLRRVEVVRRIDQASKHTSSNWKLCGHHCLHTPQSYMPAILFWLADRALERAYSVIHMHNILMHLYHFLYNQYSEDPPL